MGLRIQSTGVLQLLSGDGLVQGSTTALPTNQWIRVEAKVAAGVTGNIEARVWTTNPDSTGSADRTVGPFNNVVGLVINLDV